MVSVSYDPSGKISSQNACSINACCDSQARFNLPISQCNFDWPCFALKGIFISYDLYYWRLENGNFVLLIR